MGVHSQRTQLPGLPKQANIALIEIRMLLLDQTSSHDNRVRQPRVVKPLEMAARRILLSRIGVQESP
jgi:hypothetical protein